MYFETKMTHFDMRSVIYSDAVPTSSFSFSFSFSSRNHYTKLLKNRI